jgi:hypothetical protein
MASVLSILYTVHGWVDLNKLRYDVFLNIQFPFVFVLDRNVPAAAGLKVCQFIMFLTI